MVFAGAQDELTASPAETLTLSIGGPFAPGLSTEPDNLVLRAARALAEATGSRSGADIRLEKRLPVASGIGGGSSDAAAALNLLSRLWDVALPDEALRAVAAGLGADVPVCLARAACRMSGIGEVLSPAPRIPDCGLVLVNPGIALSTLAVFQARTAAFSEPAALPDGWADASTMARDLACLSNDLEAPALTLCPPIGAVLAALRAAPSCLLARMSGSGATCFGLFATPAQAVAAADLLRRPGWWCWGGHLYAPGGGT